MTFEEMLQRTIDTLQHRGRMSYRALKRQFDLDDAYFEDLKEEILYAYPQVTEEEGRGLVWTDTDATTSEPAPAAAQRAQAPPTSETPSAPEAERRQLTVMFCDLAESTRLSQQLDLEDLREVIRAYQETAVGVVQRFDGYPAQYLGDGLLIYFGWPQAHEDDAQRAVRAGLGIVEAITTTLNPRLEREKGVQLVVRIGLHTGPVVVGEMGGGGRHEQLALGATTNIASRLEGLAAPNTVVISNVTARLVQGYFVTQDLGHHMIRGTGTTTQLFCILGTTSAQSRLDAAGPSGLNPLVGRDAEVMLFSERWAQVKDGMGHVLMLTGEAGIGKSRLVQAMKERLSDESVTILECRCSPYHQQSALYPVIELCQRVVRWQPDDAPDVKRRKLEIALAGFSLPLTETLALFADLLSLPDEDDRQRPLYLTPQQQRKKTLEAILTIILEISSRQPVLFIVEDLHWIDPSSLEFLTHLVELTPTARLYIVFTFRETFQSLWGNRSYLTQITLTGLPRHQVLQMVTHVTGGKPLPTEVMEEIVDKTDGVPLFVEEVTKAVLETGLLRETADQYELTAPLPASTIPTTLHDSLIARLDRLGTAKSVAQLGAVLGRQFTYALLRAVAEQSDESLQYELGRLVEAELIYQKGLPQQATYTFKHALIQATAYQLLVRGTRQQYHQRIAEVLEEQFPNTVETEAELLAHHYTEAGLYEKAIAYWQQAGQRAVERSANTEAISHLNKGLELLETLQDTPERVQRELMLQLALGTTLSMVKGYSAAEVARCYNRARDLCLRAGDSPQLFAVLGGLRRFYNNLGEFETSRDLGQQHLRLAQSLQNYNAMLQAHHALGIISFHLGEFTTALTDLEEGIGYYDPQQHRPHAFDPMVLCLAYAARTLWYLGYPERALTRSREALTLVHQLPHAYTLGSTLHVIAMLHKERREPKLVQEQAEIELALGHEHGFIRWVGGGMIRRGWALAEQGATQEGIEQLSQGLAIWRDLGRFGMPQHLAMLAEAYGKAGQPEAGLHVLSDALDSVHNTAERHYEAELHRLRGELLLQEGQKRNLKEAEESFLQAFDIARQQQAKAFELRAVMSLCRVWQLQEKQREARQLLLELYGWFTEGFDTPDLREAKVLLDTLP